MLCDHHSNHCMRPAIHRKQRKRDTRIYFPFPRNTLRSSTTSPKHTYLSSRSVHIMLSRALHLYTFSYCIEHPFVFSHIQLSVAGFLPLGRCRRRRRFSHLLLSVIHTHSHIYGERVFLHRISPANVSVYGTFAALSLCSAHHNIFRVCESLRICQAASAVKCNGLFRSLNCTLH